MTNPEMLLCAFVACLFFLVLYVSLFRSPVRGIADQGDFRRMMAWVGLVYPDGKETASGFGWITRYFVYGKTSGNAMSSEILFLWIAGYINRLLGRPVFDLTLLGAVHAVSLSVVMGFLFHYLKYIGKWFRFGAALVAAWMFTDLGYTAYLNSFYQEPASWIFMFLSLAVVLKSVAEMGKGKVKTNLALFLGSSALLVTAKAQNFVLCIPMALTAWLLFRKELAIARIWIALMIFCLFSIVFAVFGTTDIIKKWNVYNTVYYQILGRTRLPNRAMKIIGVPADTFQYKGISAWDAGTGVDDPRIVPYLNETTLLRAFGYHLQTPDEWYSLTNQVTEKSFTIRVPYLGYFENDGKHPAVSGPDILTGWEILKERYLVGISRLLPVILAIGSVVFFVSTVYGAYPYSIIGVYLFSSAVFQLMIVVLSEGLAGVEKHLFLFAVTFDLILIFLLCIIGKMITAVMEKRFGKNDTVHL